MSTPEVKPYIEAREIGSQALDRTYKLLVQATREAEKEWLNVVQDAPRIPHEDGNPAYPLLNVWNEELEAFTARVKECADRYTRASEAVQQFVAGQSDVLRLLNKTLNNGEPFEYSGATYNNGETYNGEGF
jgi:hypothetical protein